jgi:hypothetical protein
MMAAGCPLEVRWGTAPAGPLHTLTQKSDIVGFPAISSTSAVFKIPKTNNSKQINVLCGFGYLKTASPEDRENAHCVPFSVPCVHISINV